MNEVPEFRGAEDEFSNQELSSQFLVLEQVRRILQLGSKDMDTPGTMSIITKDGSQVTKHTGDPKVEYISGVQQLRLLLTKKIDDPTKEELDKLDKESQEFKSTNEAQKEKGCFEWFYYSQHKKIFSVLCGYLNEINWMSSVGMDT